MLCQLKLTEFARNGWELEKLDGIGLILLGKAIYWQEIKMHENGKNQKIQMTWKTGSRKP